MYGDTPREHNAFSLDNTKLKSADLSGNQSLITVLSVWSVQNNIHIYQRFDWPWLGVFPLPCVILSCYWQHGWNQYNTLTNWHKTFIDRISSGRWEIKSIVLRKKYSFPIQLFLLMVKSEVDSRKSRGNSQETSPAKRGSGWLAIKTSFFVKWCCWFRLFMPSGCLFCFQLQFAFFSCCLPKQTSFQFNYQNAFCIQITAIL